METMGERRARRQARHRLQAVTGTSVVLVVVALILASCGVSQSTAGAPPATAHWSIDACPLEVKRIAARLAATATTTTTTRPAVNPDYGPPPENTGTGRRIVYCNSCQVVWLIDATNYVEFKYQVSGRRGTPRPGEYHVFRKLDMGRSKAHPELRLPWFVGFAWGTTTDIGFHGIPLRPDDSQIQDDSQLGQPLSSGCIRETQFWAKVLYDWTPEGTLVVVTA